MNEAYEKLKAKGFDMTWYEKRKGRKEIPDDAPAPLHSESCGRLSIYLINTQGGMYTITVKDGEATEYMWVRDTAARPKKQVYLCACCKKQFNTFGETEKHYGTDNIN